MTSRKKPQKKRSMVPFYVGGGILVLLLVAFLTSGGGGNGDNGTPTAEEYADVSVSGGSLPAYSQEAADTAVGLPMPEVTGQDFYGTPVSITNDGRAKVILLLTHW